MKKIFFLTTYLFLISFAEADTNIPLKDYLEKNKIIKILPITFFIKLV